MLKEGLYKAKARKKTCLGKEETTEKFHIEMIEYNFPYKMMSKTLKVFL